MSETPVDRIRYPLEVRWSSERGWLLVRDPFTGEWHQIEARQAPASWRREASEWKGRRSP